MVLGKINILIKTFRLAHAITISGLVSSLSGCLTTNYGKPIHTITRYIYFNDEINDENVKYITSEIMDTPLNKLYLNINSSGGDVRSALKLARVLEKQDTTIIVKDKCLSACAQIILPSAKNVEIWDNAVISLHVSSFSWIVLNEKNNIKDKDIIAFSKDLLAFYRQHNINLDYLACAAVYSKPSLIIDSNNNTELKLFSDGIIMTPNDLKKFGINSIISVNEPNKTSSANTSRLIKNHNCAAYKYDEFYKVIKSLEQGSFYNP